MELAARMPAFEPGVSPDLLFDVVQVKRLCQADYTPNVPVVIYLFCVLLQLPPPGVSISLSVKIEILCFSTALACLHPMGIFNPHSDQPRK